MVIAASNNLGKFQETNIFDKTVSEIKRGAVIRSGDIIKVGRVPIMIKESSIDVKRYEILREQNKARPMVTPRAPGYFDIKSDAEISDRSLLVTQQNNLQNMLRNATVNTEAQVANENSGGNQMSVQQISNTNNTNNA